MRFGEPSFLYLMLVLVPLVQLLVWAGRRRRALLEKFVAAGLVPRLVGSGVYAQRQNRTLLWMAATAVSLREVAACMI